MSTLLKNVFVRGGKCVLLPWCIIAILKMAEEYVTANSRAIDTFIEATFGKLLMMFISIGFGLLLLVLGVALYVYVIRNVGSYVAYLYEEVVNLMQWLGTGMKGNYKSYDERDTYSQTKLEYRIRNVCALAIAIPLLMFVSNNFKKTATFVGVVHDEFFVVTLDVVNYIWAGLIFIVAVYQVFANVKEFIFGRSEKKEPWSENVAKFADAVCRNVSLNSAREKSSSSNYDDEARKRQEEWETAMRNNPERFPGSRGPRL